MVVAILLLLVLAMAQGPLLCRISTIARFIQTLMILIQQPLVLGT